ncbi:MAG: M23 family metallopeptidase [Hyphomicrobiaceae bacterium]|nr:M23 family metallopeptidase [Hyphomicrobiaceae bacterium]
MSGRPARERRQPGWQLRAAFRRVAACGWAPAVLLASVVAGSVGAAAQGDDARLSLPIACEFGKTCFVQQHVDVQPGPGARDHACGTATYEGHAGTDFRLLSAAAAQRGVDVLAAADGTVLRARDGMDDQFAKVAGKATVEDRECGNGLVIDHGGGLETQYCHMLKGSLTVRPGQRVTRGAPLGKVGYSGLADFAHLHLTVRKAGKVVDPFTGAAPDGSCRVNGSTAEAGLWRGEVAELLAYKSVEIIQTGFAGLPPDLDKLELDHEAFVRPGRDGPALVVFARIMNLAAGDRVRITTSGPAGFGEVYAGPPVDRNKATYIAYSGKRRRGPAWMPGRYDGTIEVLRGDRAIVTGRAEQVID